MIQRIIKMEKRIDVKRVKEHFEIFVDGIFECSCDVGELSETIEEIEKNCLQMHSIVI